MSANWLLTVGRDGRILDQNDASRDALGDVRGRRCCEVIRAESGAERPCSDTCSAGLLAGDPAKDHCGRLAARHVGRLVCDAVGDVVVVTVLDAGEPTTTATLTPREREVLTAVARGGTNAAIARTLGIRPATVRTHLEHIRDKWNVRTRAEAVAQAIANGEIRLHR